jgi:hypothetical protein
VASFAALQLMGEFSPGRTNPAALGLIPYRPHGLDASKNMLSMCWIAAPNA